MKVYDGIRVGDALQVLVGTVVAGSEKLINPTLLPPRYDLRNHSPDGFECGYGGSGPSQLALALCADALQDDARAQAMYQHYKWAHVVNFPTTGKWRLTEEQIRSDIETLEGK